MGWLENICELQSEREENEPQTDTDARKRHGRAAGARPALWPTEKCELHSGNGNACERGEDDRPTTI